MRKTAFYNTNQKSEITKFSRLSNIRWIASVVLFKPRFFFSPIPLFVCKDSTESSPKQKGTAANKNRGSSYPYIGSKKSNLAHFAFFVKLLKGTILRYDVLKWMHVTVSYRRRKNSSLQKFKTLENL